MEQKQRKTGLVMEGGAMRGMFTCGVIDVFMENGVAFDGAAGISAGAAFGCNFKSRQVGRPLRYNQRFCRDRRYCSLWSLLRTGDLYGADFCYRILPDELDVFDRAAFRENPMAFYIGATDVNTGQIVYHLCSDGGEEDVQWMRASASMPLVSRPVKIGEKLLLDGGISDPVPYAFLEAQGYGPCVAVLTQPRGYRKKQSAALPLLRLPLKKYPRIAEALAARPALYNGQMEEIDRREKEGTLLVLRPPAPLAIGHTEKDPRELERVYQIGRREALGRLKEVGEWLRR